MFYLLAASLILALRLWIWKFFPGLESGLKDDLSNMIVAGCVFALAFIFFMHRFWRRQGLVASGLEGPLSLYVLAASASVTWSLDAAASVRALVMLVAYLFFFVVLFHVLLDDRRRRIFIWVFFAASVVVACYGINDIIILSRVSPQELENARLTNKSIYYILTHKRACSLFGWPNVLAGFLMLGMPLAAALFMAVKQRWIRALVAAGGALMLAAFYFTFSFLGWSVFLAVMMVLALLMIVCRAVAVPRRFWWAGGAGFLLVAVLFAGVIIKKDFAGSLAPRKEYARIVRAVIAEHPLKGCGFGAYRAASFKFVTSVDAETAFPHNTYAQVWAETGIPGLAAILWLISLAACMAGRVWRARREGALPYFFIAVSAGLAAYLIDNVNSFTMLKPNASFFFWTWLALFCSYAAGRDDAGPLKAGFRQAGLVLLAAVALAGAFQSVRSALSLAALRAGNEAVSAGVFALARGYFARAHALDPLDPMVLTTQGNLYLKAYRATARREWLDLAERSFVGAADGAPHYYYNHLALSKIYGLRGDRDRADAALATAMAVSPYETSRDNRVFSRP